MVWKRIVQSNVYSISIAAALKIFSRKNRASARKVTLLTIINSAVEVLGLTMIIPIIYLINDSNPIYNNPTLNKLFVLSGIEKEPHFVLALIIGMGLIFILKNIFSIFVYYKQNAFAFNTAADLVERQSANFLDLNYLQLKESNSNYFVRDIATIPKEFASSILIPILKVTNELMVLILIIIGLVSYNLEVFLLLAVTMAPLIYFILIATRDKADQLGKDRNRLMPIAYQNAYELVFSYIDVKLNKRETFFIHKITSYFRQLFAKDLWLYTLQRIPHRVMEFSIILAIALLYTIVIIWMKRPPGEVVWILILFATASYRVMPSLNEIMGSLILIRSGQYIFEILKTKDVSFNHHQVKPQFKDKIELNNISYKYPDGKTAALQNINLTIPKGTTIGIIGKSGSGKTTLGKLLLRLVTEQSGSYKVDDVAVNNIINWQSIVSYVQQDFHIMDCTLAENIAFGIDRDNIDINKLEKIIDQVNLTGFVNELTNGYDHNVGEFGANLSGGERQRIAIARALYGDSQLLVMDEATNSLDSPMEDEIMDTINELSDTQLTILVISHRITTLRHCDRIYELKDGELVDEHEYATLKNI